MSTNVDDAGSPIGESNVELVASEVAGAIMGDINGTELVEVFEILLNRAREVKDKHASAARRHQDMVEGKEAIDVETIQAMALDSGYETTCLRWFIARACRKIADILEYDCQSRSARIERVNYGENGEIASFKIEKK